MQQASKGLPEIKLSNLSAKTVIRFFLLCSLCSHGGCIFFKLEVPYWDCLTAQEQVSEVQMQDSRVK